MKNHLKEIIFELVKSNVEFVIGGGVAAVLHGVERLTMDLDLAVKMNSKNLTAFIDVMKKLKLVPRVPIPPTELLYKNKVKMMVEEKHAVVFTFIDIDFPVRQVDIFLKESHSYENLKKNSEVFEMENISFLVVTKNKLLDLKKKVIPPRKKDLWDIEILSKLIDEEK